MSCGLTPNFSRIPAASRIDFAPAVDLHHARTSHALRQILIGRPDGDFLDLLVLRRDMRGRSERIIGFELDHRPDDNAHRRERLLERMELREQRGLDAGAGLVVRPKPIAKRLDHVVGGDAEVRVAALDHLEHGLQHTDDSAVRTVLAFGKPAQAVEVTEELVGTVDEMTQHHFWAYRSNFSGKCAFRSRCRMRR